MIYYENPQVLQKVTAFKKKPIVNCKDCYKKDLCSKVFGNFDNISHIIRRRDDYTCQNCGIKEKSPFKKHSVHHIDENRKNNNSENLITLCRACHGIFHIKYYGIDNEPELNIKYKYTFLNNITKEIYRQYQYKRPSCPLIYTRFKYE